jgi:predicted neutral ceramidase superfamily lipid hydrolase
MFGRSQYKWLFLATIIGILTCFFPFFRGTRLSNGQEMLSNVTTASNMLVATLTMSVTVGAFTVSHLFSNRKQQLILTVIAIVMSILNLVFLFMESSQYLDGEYKWSAVFAFSLPVLLGLAAFSMYKDNQVVKGSGERSHA